MEDYIADRKDRFQVGSEPKTEPESEPFPEPSLPTMLFDATGRKTILELLSRSITGI